MSDSVLDEIARRLGGQVSALTFGGKVAHVYNPLIYAAAPHFTYLQKYAARGPRKYLLVGMNPGPFGMAQTGVPFGEVAHARDFLRVQAPVASPEEQHPKRPVLGFACPRSEVSGKRLWGWVRTRYGSPERFFSEFFVWNYCPLMFLDAGGRNLTPDKLPAADHRALTAVCDEALRGVVAALQPERVIGVGVYAEGRARAALQGQQVKFGKILHPSPASPAANRGWAPQAEAQLRAMGIKLPGDGEKSD